MPGELVIYEQPLNERMRIFMRLEHLFSQALYNLRGASVWDSRQTLETLIDILNVFDRTDLKTEVLKELERHTANLARLEQSPGVDWDKLNRVLDEIEVLLEGLYNYSGRIGQALRENEFLSTIRQRSAIPGGTCDFDLPLYHHWLERPPEERIRDLERWLTDFEPIRLAINLVLRLVRSSAAPAPVLAAAGFFQRSLDPGIPYQMLRVSLPAASALYPEISAGKHRFTVRFLVASRDQRPTQTEEDVDFQLTSCPI